MTDETRIWSKYLLLITYFLRIQNSIETILTRKPIVLLRYRLTVLGLGKVIRGVQKCKNNVGMYDVPEDFWNYRIYLRSREC